MKKVLVLLFVAMALIGLSCQSTVSGAVIEGEVTQEKVDKALEQIYSAFSGKLDLSGAQNYTVVSGDTLSGIARRFYGDLTGVGKAGPSNGFYFPVIMLASSNAGIADPERIEPGMKLTIPDLKKNLDNSAARQAIKDCLKDFSYVYDKKGRDAEKQGLADLANSL